jgi:coenzyme F420-reducing hydrogenase beta subunit
MYNTSLIDIFDSLFYQHIVLRPSCHACVFTNFERSSDITIADFWGIEKYKSDFDDNKGVSLVLINSKKGEMIFKNVKRHLIYEISNMVECKQRHLTTPAEPSPKRDTFWKEYNEHGFEYVAKKYTNYGFINKFKPNVLKHILCKLGIIIFLKSKIKKY